MCSCLVVCDILYVGCCILYVDRHSLNVWCIGATWSIVSSLLDVSASTWAVKGDMCDSTTYVHAVHAVQALCGLLQALRGLLHPLCRILQHMCMLWMRYVYFCIIYVGYCSLYVDCHWRRPVTKTEKEQMELSQGINTGKEDGEQRQVTKIWNQD